MAATQKSHSSNLAHVGETHHMQTERKTVQAKQVELMRRLIYQELKELNALTRKLIVRLSNHNQE